MENRGLADETMTDGCLGSEDEPPIAGEEAQGQQAKANHRAAMDKELVQASLCGLCSVVGA